MRYPIEKLIWGWLYAVNRSSGNIRSTCIHNKFKPWSETGIRYPSARHLSRVYALRTAGGRGVAMMCLHTGYCVFDLLTTV